MTSHAHLLNVFVDEVGDVVAVHDLGHDVVLLVRIAQQVMLCTAKQRLQYMHKISGINVYITAIHTQKYQ